MQYVNLIFKSGRNPISGNLRYAIASNEKTVVLEWEEKHPTGTVYHISEIPRHLIDKIVYL